MPATNECGFSAIDGYDLSVTNGEAYQLQMSVLGVACQLQMSVACQLHMGMP